MYTFLVVSEWEKSDKSKSEEEVKDFIAKTKDEVVELLSPRLKQHAEMLAEIKDLQEHPTFKVLLKIPGIVKKMKSNISKLKDDLAKLPKLS